MTQSAAMRTILAREGRMHEVDRRKVQRSLPRADFDLIAHLDCLHDMGDPLRAARRARSSRMLPMWARLSPRNSSRLRTAGKRTTRYRDGRR